MSCPKSGWSTDEKHVHIGVSREEYVDTCAVEVVSLLWKKGFCIFKGKFMRIKLHRCSTKSYCFGLFTQVVSSIKKKMSYTSTTKLNWLINQKGLPAFLYQPIACYILSSWLILYSFSYRFSITFISGHKSIFFHVCQSHFDSKSFDFSVGAHSLPLITSPICLIHFLVY